jgi:hypothetical protein
MKLSAAEASPTVTSFLEKHHMEHILKHEDMIAYAKQLSRRCSGCSAKASGRTTKTSPAKSAHAMRCAGATGIATPAPDKMLAAQRAPARLASTHVCTASANSQASTQLPRDRCPTWLGSNLNMRTAEGQAQYVGASDRPAKALSAWHAEGVALGGQAGREQSLPDRGQVSPNIMLNLVPVHPDTEAGVQNEGAHTVPPWAEATRNGHVKHTDVTALQQLGAWNGAQYTCEPRLVLCHPLDAVDDVSGRPDVYERSLTKLD